MNTLSLSQTNSSFSGDSSRELEEEEIIYEPLNTSSSSSSHYVGEFREGEIDGKPFHIFRTESSATGAPPLFICQYFHNSYEWLSRRENDPISGDFLPVDVYPQFFNKRRGDEQFKNLIGSKIYENPCKLPLLPLFWCNNKQPDYEEFFCGVCRSSKLSTDYYVCVDRCGKKFHKECIECPVEIKHPSYPFLSLKLYYPPYSTREFRCFSCLLSVDVIFYYCPTNELVLHPICALKPIPIVINHPKRHLHPLNFFPRQAFLPCGVCGLIKEPFPTYVCAQCVFVTHQDCVYHLYVIKISRHHHRISFTYSLPSGKWSCGVCRRPVNNNYGAYSCNKCDDYFVHTKCALREDLWDGEELEGVPEEPEEVVEPPFKEITDGIILHFSHDHHLKLEFSRVYDEGKVCQACVLPIYEGSYYSCMDECDFILHKECASASRKKQHALCAVSLKLKVVTQEYDDGKGCFRCHGCERMSCGFVYEDAISSRGFKLDLRCASVSEPFEYEGHEHPLFLALTPEEEKTAICQICQEESDRDNRCKKLTCIECSYVICFKCATLPYKARYKHDKHLLTFREKEEGNDHLGWCGICERKLVYSRKRGFYSCDEYCSTTVHVHCLLGGEDMYLMKPGQTISLNGKVDDIVGNNTMSRPFCNHCEHRCQDKVVFKRKNMTFCSTWCSFFCKG